MGLINIILKEELYDEEFVEKWTNAHHLIRKDNGKLLREKDLIKKGSFKNFVVWDSIKQEPVIWNSSLVKYKTQNISPALNGEFEISLSNNKKIQAETVWDVFSKEAEKYSPDYVADITGVSKADIIKAARFYAKSKPAAIHWGVPIDMTPGITPTAQAIANLWCLTGNLDVPGGNVISRFAFDAVAYALPGAEGVIKLASKNIDKKRIGADRYGPLNKFIWRAQTDLVLNQIFTEDPYPIRGMWIQACNPISGIGLDPKKWLKAIKKLDFVVAVDLFMTATTQFADIVLPAASFLEKDGIRSWWVPLQTINKAISVGECKPDVEINFELAKRFDPNFKWKTIYDLYDEILKPSNMTFKELQKKGGWILPPKGHPSSPYRRYEKGLLRPDRKEGFQTPSGKIELYSSLREEWNLEPIAHYEEPPFTPISQPELAKEYPLILSTGRRSAVYFHSEHRNIPWLRQIDPDPIIEINPETAESYNIGNGEWVWVENWLGKCMFKAKITPIVPPNMVMTTHGWWFPEKPAAEPILFDTWKSNINQLIPMDYQGKDGLGAPIKQLLCKIYKVNGGK
jgi:anaerobic selenocysteine-containing dehydrogenase